MSENMIDGRRCVCVSNFVYYHSNKENANVLVGAYRGI